MKQQIHFSELLCIWKTQPCGAGYTLSGGERVANLKRLGLISKDDFGKYRITDKGQRVLDMTIAAIDTQGVFVETSVKIGEQ